ncbi:MAG: hypothetical protein LQ341_005171 [Variospora aurantia]|nr:MAG: hypothetical protein LQ341_005171 [Variospora aurantia]
MLVFGLETTFRSLHRKRFQPQTRWNIRLCILAIMLMTTMTWIPSYVSPARPRCLASLVWWTKHLAKVGLVLSSGLLLTFLVCAGVITVQLIRTINMSRDQRIAATRTVYYLAISALIMIIVSTIQPCCGALLRSPADQSQGLMIPFLARTTIQINAIAASQVAEVALNVLGIIHLLLHVFLRANAELTAIQKVEATWTKRQRLRLFGPSDLEMTMHITSPVLLEKGEARRFDDDNYKLTKDFRRFSRIPQSSSPPTIPADAQITCPMDYTSDAKVDHPEPAPLPPQVYLSPCTPRKASNYSMFPTFRSAMLRNSTSTTFSQGSDDALEPLKPILPVGHKREFSEQTSATVHIGCRLSNLSDAHHSSHSSSTHNSFPLPLYGTDRAGIESSPIGPTSSRPKAPSELSQDIVFLPIQNYRISQEKAVRSSRPEYLVRTWFTRRKSRSRSEYGRMTMKALPPDPPVENSL